MVKFNVSVLNYKGFFQIIKHMHEHNYSFNSTLTKLVSILTKKIFSCLNPTSYLNAIFTKKLSIIYYLPPPPPSPPDWCIHM